MQIIHTTRLQNSISNIAQFSDRELYAKCKEYGSNARMWAKKFAALLPEVERRQLYRKHGFYSIFEFSAKLAGMGRETVLEVLRVAKKLEDKPVLLATMETHGWGKLKVVANMATKETETMWAEKVKEMSLSTLATFVKEIRKQNDEPVQNRIDSATHARSACAIIPESEQLAAGELTMHDTPAKQNSFFETASSNHVSEPTSLPSRISVRMPLKPETELRLRQLQKKLSREAGAPADFNHVMETLLDSYEINLKKRKSQQVEIRLALDELEQKAQEKFQELEERAPYESKPKRSISTIIKKFIVTKSEDRCAYPDCQKLPEIFHHTRRFALAPDHNPEFLVPLCKEHERLAHHGLIENEEKSPEEWRIKTEANKNAAKFEIDKKVNAKRNSA